MANAGAAATANIRSAAKSVTLFFIMVCPVPWPGNDRVVCVRSLVDLIQQGDRKRAADVIPNRYSCYG